MKVALKPRVIHGTPITPKSLLKQLRGESFCVSFHRPEQIEDVIPLQDKNGMLLLDNGAFSHWKAGHGRIDRTKFFAWANDIQSRCEVAVAVIPDIIEGGSEEENWMEAAYAVRDLSKHSERLMFCWHMTDSLDQLKRACRLFNFVAIGSSQEFDIQRNKAGYLARLKEAKAVIDYVELEYGRRPWVHLMRAQAVLPQALFANSADSINVAVNHHRLKRDPATASNRAAIMANRVRAGVARAAVRARVAPAHPTSNFTDGPTRAPRSLSKAAQQPEQLKEAA